MLILECSQGCYGRTEGSVTIFLRNFVGEGIKKNVHMKTGFLRIFFWTFIEVKRTITPNEQFFIYTMTRTSYISMRWWWCPLCTNTLRWIFMVLAHWNNSLLVDMSLHLNTLFWFWANESLLLFLNAVCLSEMQQIPYQFLSLWFDLSWARTHDLLHSRRTC